jgi:hypothetical protein
MRQDRQVLRLICKRVNKGYVTAYRHACGMPTITETSNVQCSFYLCLDQLRLHANSTDSLSL